MSEKDERIGGVAAMVTIMYSLGLTLVYFWNKAHPRNPDENHFSEVGKSIFARKFPKASMFLLIFRVLGFFYWLGLGWTGKWVRDYVEKGKLPRYYMFTHWNMILLSVYFCASALASILERWSHVEIKRFPEASYTFRVFAWWNATHKQRLSSLVRILFAVCSASALFVSTTAYDPKGGFWATVGHLTNMIWIFLELVQNPLVIQVQHLSWFMSWCYAYICVIWILVKAWGGQSWPYPFLETYTTAAAAYTTYAGIFFVQLLAFAVMKLVTEGKIKLYRYMLWIEEDSNNQTLTAVSSIELENL